MAKNYAFWDYDVSKMDLSDPEVLRFYLTRKISCGDYKGIRKEDLRKHLDYLDIDPYKKIVLKNYLKKYAKK